MFVRCHAMGMAMKHPCRNLSETRLRHGCLDVVAGGLHGAGPRRWGLMLRLLDGLEVADELDGQFVCSRWPV
jgi:hypothetical protein